MTDTRKKILVFIGASYVSGLEVVTLHLIKGLKENGYEVRCLISGWNDGNFKQKLEAIHVQYYEVKIGWLHLRKPLWTIDTLLHYPKAFFSTKKILSDFDPDICHFCNFFMPVMLFPLIKAKAVYNLQETYPFNNKHKRIFKLLNKKVNYFTAVSEHIVRVLEGLTVPREKIKLIYNGIPPVKAEPIGANVYDPVLIFAIIGQVVPWKGHDILLSAVELLIKNGITDFKVQVWGNDQTTYGKELKEKIKQRKVEIYYDWKGFVNDQDIVYKDSSVVIVPSLSGEPCSLTIIESMSREKGVIVSDKGGNPELVQDGQTGLVFKASDPPALYNGMSTLIKDRNRILQLATNAGQRAAQNYTSRLMTKNYMDLYEQLYKKANSELA